MRTPEEKRHHVRCQTVVTGFVLTSIVAAELWPEYFALRTSLEVFAVLTWIWIE